MTYYDFAENDYNFLIHASESGMRDNALAAISQSVCERFMKHLIDKYYSPGSIFPPLSWR